MSQRSFSHFLEVESFYTINVIARLEGIFTGFTQVRTAFGCINLTHSKLLKGDSYRKHKILFH